jgi:glutathione S-transferase
VADLCVASVLVWAKTSELLMSEFPHVKAWLETCVARPTFSQARKMA